MTRNSASWLKMILDIPKLSDTVFNDVCRLLTTVLSKTEKSPKLLLRVSPNAGSAFPPAGTDAFTIDDTYLKLLVFAQRLITFF